MPQASTVDKDDVARFSALAAQWWNPHGAFKPLHKFNPTRIDYIRAHACTHFGRDSKSFTPFDGLRLLDIGCGGGLLSEPMCRLGAHVTGVDASEKNIRIAQTHAQESGLAIDYQHTTAEALAQTPARFDIILNMEVVEHVADVPLFLHSCATLLAENGLMVVATLNRTLKSLLLAKIGAEYILRWLPIGTHTWQQFLKPAEVATPLTAAGLTQARLDGVTYNPLRDSWSLSNDTDVNYLMVFTKPR